MTFEQFRALQQNDQIAFLAKSGVAVAESHHQQYVTFLYYVTSFFVVVIYDTETDDLLKVIPLQQRDGQEDLQQQFPFYHNN